MNEQWYTLTQKMRAKTATEVTKYDIVRVQAELGATQQWAKNIQRDHFRQELMQMPKYQFNNRFSELGIKPEEGETKEELIERIIDLGKSISHPYLFR